MAKMVPLLIKTLLALALALPLGTASAQTVDVSNSAIAGGALNAPAGRITSFSAGVTGVGVANVSIQSNDFSVTRTGNDPVVATGGEFSAQGNVSAAPGSRAEVMVNHRISPERIPDIKVTGGNSFNVAPSTGNVFANIISAPPVIQSRSIQRQAVNRPSIQVSQPTATRVQTSFINRPSTRSFGGSFGGSFSNSAFGGSTGGFFSR